LKNEVLLANNLWREFRYSSKIENEGVRIALRAHIFKDFKKIGIINVNELP